MTNIGKTDTIVALATPPGRGGIAVIRISGPLVKSIAEQLLGEIPKPRFAEFHLFKNTSNEAMDEGLALFFPSPHSFTGEDVLELQGHGGTAVTNSLIRRIVELGARLARPGEFSERAFLNNKIDLTQAEAIADLIDAATEQAARASMRSLQGKFSKKIKELVEKLIQLRIYVEAAIDFVEEEIDFLASQQIIDDLLSILEQLKKVELSAMQGSLLREGITVVIAGEPNVGKSSLLNCLSGKESAIVTHIPGTTRDVLREYIHLDGMPIHIIDTAGLRESEDIVEQEGIRRAYDEFKKADLILYIVDAQQKNDINSFTFTPHIPVIIVRNKIDLTHEPANLIQENNQTIISLSAKNQLGIELLKNSIQTHVGFQLHNEGVFSARRRHLDAIKYAKKFLQNGLHQLQEYQAGELLAEDLRQAQQALNEITGEFTTDDLLGRIFSSFCVGK